MFSIARGVGSLLVLDRPDPRISLEMQRSHQGVGDPGGPVAGVYELGVRPGASDVGRG
ncbi:MAG: hypothetical protein QOG99_996 [Frankiales bacterium]|jgi:hypothetical protein|nr:hypothetical protein [Frankiales bacterium]